MPLPAVFEDVDPSLHDPEVLTLLVVQQWLEESGYHDGTLGILADRQQIVDAPAQTTAVTDPHGNHVEPIEQEMTREVDEEEFAKQEEEEHLLRGGKEDYACMQIESVEGVHPSNITCVRVLPSGTDVISGSGTCCCEEDHACMQIESVEGVHPSNITCVRVLPSGAAVISGSGDGYVRCVSFKGEVAWSSKVGSGGVLCLDLHTDTSRATRVLAGSMDGSVTVLDASSGSTLSSLTGGHSKYVVRAIWAPDGATLATCSYDQHVGIHCLERVDGNWSIRTLKKQHNSPSPTAHPATTITPVTLDPMQIYKIQSSLKREATQGVAKRVIATGAGSARADLQDTVRFEAYLLASTDTSRVLMLCASDWSQVRNFYGVPVHIFHVGTAKVVAKISGHKINVRDLDFHHNKDSGLGLLF
eukprot:gene3936-14013_t